MKRLVSQAQYARLEQKAGRRPVIAMMGEFSAGKSTLMNFLLGKNVLPTKVTATELPPVWMSFGQGNSYRIDRHGSRFEVDFRDPTSMPIDDTRFVRAFSDADYLENYDLIDLPGISDPNFDRELWIDTAAYADFIIWCSHATQAWRQSEISVWKSLPERLRANSILVLTRADKLISSTERSKVLGRVRREAHHLFRTVLLFSTIQASRAREVAGEQSEAWSRSGAPELFDAIQESASNITRARRDLLARYQTNSNQLTELNVWEAPSESAIDRAASSATISPRRVSKTHSQSRDRLSDTQAELKIEETTTILTDVQKSGRNPDALFDDEKATPSREQRTQTSDPRREEEKISEIRRALLTDETEDLDDEQVSDELALSRNEENEWIAQVHSFLNPRTTVEDHSLGSVKEKIIELEGVVSSVVEAVSPTAPRTSHTPTTEPRPNAVQLAWRSVIEHQGGIDSIEQLVAIVDQFLHSLPDILAAAAGSDHEGGDGLIQ